MNSLRFVFILLCLLLSVPVFSGAACPGESKYAWFYLDGSSCQGGGLQFLNVIAETNPASKAKITLIPPPGGTFFGATWIYPSTGDVTTGIEFDIPCHQGTVTLGQIVVIGGSTPWGIGSNCEIKDCSGTSRPAGKVDPFPLSCNIPCISTAPYGLFPPNGANGVALNVALSWAGPALFSSVPAWINIGTSADCSGAQHIPVDATTRSVVLNFLQPATTYYWQASYDGSAPQCSYFGNSAVHSFTTAGPLAVEATTWGNVKAMYRE